MATNKRTYWPWLEDLPKAMPPRSNKTQRTPTPSRRGRRTLLLPVAGYGAFHLTGAEC